MQIIPIKTHLIKLGESLKHILDKYLLEVYDNDIIAITSKIISVCQSRVIKKNGVNKKDLILQEADAIAQTELKDNDYGIYLTIKNNILIPSAGIDESNANDSYILYPHNIPETVNFIWDYLRNKHSVNNLGVIMTDSHTTPMRQGVTGICIGWCGFEPLYSYINKPDLYGRSLKVTKINLLDALATASVLVMGEGNEQIPITIIRNPPKVSFLNRQPTIEEHNSVKIPIEQDLYYPLMKNVKWQLISKN
jgi:dihydrofolate synthase / folylpolyglutamate synthase